MRTLAFSTRAAKRALTSRLETRARLAASALEAFCWRAPPETGIVEQNPPAAHLRIAPSRCDGSLLSKDRRTARPDRFPEDDAMRALLIVLAWALPLLPASGRSPAKSDAEFESKVRPVLVAHCYGCHSTEKPKGDFRLDKLSPDLPTARAATLAERAEARPGRRDAAEGEAAAAGEGGPGPGRLDQRRA